MKFTDQDIFKLSQYSEREKYLLSLPGCVYSKDSFGNYLRCNQEVVNLAGKTSVNDILGRTDLDFLWRDRYDLYKNNDRFCEENRRPYYFFEPARTSSNEVMDRLNIKAPLIGLNKNVLGTIGVSISLYQSNFDQVLSQFLQASAVLGLQLGPRLILGIVSHAIKLTHCHSQWSRESNLFDYGIIRFTYREAQCLHYFLKGYSAKKSANLLAISQKTIEFHLANIKTKLHCQSKSGIVDKAIEYGFIDLIFIEFNEMRVVS